MQASIELNRTPEVQYLLRIGDTCLVLAQRLGEWCGHAPVLEEDMAMANIALDLIGQARALLTHAGRLEGEGRGHDEDQLAYLRDERDYFNLTIAELPRGDFAFAVVRNTMLATLLKLLWQRLAASSDAEVAAIAAKAVKEARYHQQHSGDWMLRLGDGTEESRRRVEKALRQLWLYVPEMFESDAVDAAASASGFGPAWSELREPWHAEMRQVLDAAGLAAPREAAFRSTGKQGLHSEHMGYILAEMQHLQRSFPGGAW
ncbi:1,2-phenylacetyl-CoA epoxidase subunit PaaC [Xylophilus sp. ASV27]|uniref:1,2-phenylacetyl-CoA epoxidase subunit PaaC n=1 Tax=Xylophilus sp. ASV27 TaxID=2795129 RepID=UPI0018EDDA45|nr:1,2-phenylacetyl-CoA epoxidase subunit PaaC [Xylophilus sp. ASV27]